MAIKLILLKSGETIISDAKQLVSTSEPEGEKKVHSYILTKPHKVQIYKDYFSPSDEESDENNKQEHEVKVSLSPWILLTDEENIHLQLDWVVTIVDPIDSLLKMYQEKTNG